jgi:AraC-like DNA-binding protein
MNTVIPFEENTCFYILGDDPGNHVSCGVHTVAEHLRRRVSNHSLPYLTFNCVLYGGGKLNIGGKKFDLCPGFTFVRYPDTVFSIERSADYVEFAIALPQEFGVLLRNYLPEDALFVRHALSEDYLKSMQGIFTACRNTPKNKLLVFAAQAFKYIVSQCLEPGIDHLSGDALFGEQACRLLDEAEMANPGREAAQKMGMGYENFRKKFKAVMKISPKQYLTRKKLRKAAALLAEGNSIKELAEKISYSDISAFSRQFKKQFDVSPSEFRKSARQKFY